MPGGAAACAPRCRLGRLVRGTCGARAASCRARSPAGSARSGPTAPSATSPIAVNGRIEAVGRSFHLEGRTVESYSRHGSGELARTRAATRSRCSRSSRDGEHGAAGSRLSSCRGACRCSGRLHAVAGHEAQAPRRPSAARRSCSSCSTSSRPTTCCGPTGSIDAERVPELRARWRRSRPGSRTRPRCTTRPSARCRRSSTARLPRPRHGARTCAATSRASSTCWTGSDTRCSRSSRRRRSARRAICPGARTRRPGVLERLAGGGRPARFHKWVGAIRNRPQPTFYFQHALMPHEPWIYLPSGHQSRPAGKDPIQGINHDVGLRRSGPDRPEPPAPPAPGGIHRPARRASCCAACERTGLLERALSWS